MLKTQKMSFMQCNKAENYDVRMENLTKLNIFKMPLEHPRILDEFLFLLPTFRCNHITCKLQKITTEK